MLKSKGRLLYDPKRGNMKKNTKWWAVLQTDPGIVEYYSYQIKKNPLDFGETHIDLKAPSWGSHISIIRGEEPKRKNLWKKFHKKEFEFEYSPIVRRAGDKGKSGPSGDKFWFVDVHCPSLIEVRRELGLPIETPQGVPYSFHLTIGRVY